MIRVLILSNDARLGDAMLSRLTDEIGAQAIHLTRRGLDTEDHPSIVVLRDEGKPAKESVFYSFSSSPYKTQEHEKRDAANFIWVLAGLDL